MSLKAVITVLLVLLVGTVSSQSAAVKASSATRLEIAVSGSSKRVPDLAIISAGVETISRDASAAINDNAQKIDNIMNSLISIGITGRDISTASVHIRSIDHFQDGQTAHITGYQAFNRITVRFYHVEKIGEVLKIFATHGANQIIGPSMAIGRPDEALNEARLDAINNARNLSALYANATKLKVKNIRSITEKIDGDFSIRPLIMSNYRNIGLDSSKSMLLGEQIIHVNLHVVFELQ